MVSILTNSSAMNALSLLRRADTSVERAQSGISSGYRISTAADNAAYWSIATTMRSDNKAMSAVEDALALGAAKVDAAYTGMTAAIDVMNEVKSKLVAAQEPGIDKVKLGKEINELRAQLVTIAKSANFSGENWLNFGATDVPWRTDTISLVGSFTRSGDGNVRVTTIDLTRQDVYDKSTQERYVTALIDNSTETHGEFGILSSDHQAYNRGMAVGYVMVLGSGPVSNAYSSGPHTVAISNVEIGLTASTTMDEVDNMLTVVDSMVGEMIDASTTFGAIGARVALQKTFATDLRHVVNEGIGRLVDADLNEESARIKALQTQKMIGVQVLSIANANAQNILSLFR